MLMTINCSRQLGLLELHNIPGKLRLHLVPRLVLLWYQIKLNVVCFYLFLFVLVLKQNKCHLVLHPPEQNKWGKKITNHLVPKQNKCHLVLHPPKQNKWKFLGINHLVLKQNKCHLVLSQPEQNK